MFYYYFFIYIYILLYLNKKINIKLIYIFNKIKNYLLNNKINMGIGDWGLGPIPNPQSPIPNPHIYYYY